jgi:prophage regulatory protein
MPTKERDQSVNILRVREVVRRTGIPTSSLYTLMEADDPESRFPAPIPLGPRRVGWVESEVDAWLRARIAKRGRPIVTQARSRPRLRRSAGGE